MNADAQMMERSLQRFQDHLLIVKTFDPLSEDKNDPPFKGSYFLVYLPTHRMTNTLPFIHACLTGRQGFSSLEEIIFPSKGGSILFYDLQFPPEKKTRAFLERQNKIIRL